MFPHSACYIVLLFLCLERTHGCLGAWEGGRVKPGPPPLGPWGTSWGAPRGGGFPAQCLRVVGRRAPLGFASKFMSILTSIFGRFGLDLGSLLGVMFGHFGAFFGLSWSWSRLRTVLSSKNDFSRNITGSNGFGLVWTLRWGQDRLKFAQDGSKIVLDRSFFVS